VAGVLGIASASVFGAWGTARTTAANASLLNLTIPIVTALLAAAVLHERMTAARWASLGIAILAACGFFSDPGAGIRPRRRVGR